MTSPTHAPVRRRLTRSVTLALLLAILISAAPPAQAGGDDFDFGKKLAEARYFDYARKVYDAILKDRNRTDEEKDEARYGLALLKKEEAMAAAAKAGTPYDEIVQLFESASSDIEKFVEKNPKNDKAGQARLDVGTIRLAFVQWARELLDDPAEVNERGFDMGKLSDDARSMVDKAIAYFKALRPRESNDRPKPYQVLASYYYVISQYYRALVEPPCSPSQMQALKTAGDDLEEYITFHDGELLAVYAQDIYGLVWWEQAKCEEDPEKKFDFYMKAFEWFETCIYTDDEGADHLRIITSGYYHIAQAGADAGRLRVNELKNRNFARDALTHLESMLERHPTAWRTDNGLRALIEWSNLECRRGNTGRAIEVASNAGDRAKKAGKPYLERLASRKLSDYVSGGCGGSSAGVVSPDVLLRVAEDLFLAGQWRKAIRAYKQVIAATPSTSQAFIQYRWKAWLRMGAAYRQLKDPLGEALAYEPIHDAWKLGRIPYEKGKSDDENMVNAGTQRRKTESAIKKLAEITGSRVFQDLYTDIRDKFLKDYPLHFTVEASEWNAGIDKWKQGTRQKTANDSRWRKTLGDALKHFVNVSKNPKARYQDLAWVYRARVPFELGQYAEAVKVAKEAWAMWDSPEAKAQEEEFESIRQRRTEARIAMTIWHGRCLKELGKHDEVIALLKDYHASYPDLTGHYPSMAYDYLIQSYIAKADILEADKYYRRLLASDPKYFNLYRITFLLAGHYDKQREAIQEKLRGVTTNLNETRRELREASKEALRIGALVSDLLLRENKAKEALRVNDERIKEGIGKLDEEILKSARETLEELKTRIPEMQAQLAKVSAPRDKLQTDATALLTEQQALRQEIYEPLTMAAGYYYEWDRALKAVGVKRNADNVAAFAQMYWSAGRLRPELGENWAKAKELYEEYLEFPSVKKLPKSHGHVRTALARLGDVYVNLAESETEATARRALVMRAVELLQNAIAKNASDNDLVVGMLSDKVLVLNWRHPSTGKRWRFAIPRPATVKALRDSVDGLGTDGGYPLPELENVQLVKERDSALRLFRRELKTQDDGALKPLVSQSGKSTFDPYLFRELANSQEEYRLALAWIYSKTGREEDVPKAVNLALSLLAGPIAAEDDSEVWWRARRIQMEVYLQTADRKLTEGTASAEASDWLERAANVYKGVVANYPYLGDAVIPGNRARWVDMLGTLNSLRRKAGLVPVDVKISDPLKPDVPDDSVDDAEDETDVEDENK